MQILDKIQIKQKIKRLAFEILENNFEEKEIILAGINNNGTGFAKMLQEELSKLSDIPLQLTQIKLNPANPILNEITVALDTTTIGSKTIILVDDVANTGRTLFYAFKPFLEVLPKKIEVAVLIDRTHKAFPVKVDYVGLSLATTLKENIEVNILGNVEMSVHLN